MCACFDSDLLAYKCHFANRTLSFPVKLMLALTGMVEIAPNFPSSIACFSLVSQGLEPPM